MNEPEMTCLRCKTAMIAGFLAGSPSNSVVVTSWVEGTPQRPHGFALDVVQVKPSECVPVRTFRCPSCGYIESNAIKEEAE